MIEIITAAGHYGRTSDVQLTVEGKNVYNRHHPHTVNFYTDGTKELSAGCSIISAHPGRPVERITVRTGDLIKVDGIVYRIVGNRMSDPSLIEV